MRPLIAALLLGLAMPAVAQQPAGPVGDGTARSPGPPLDMGPRTPDADAAHRGGGVVLEGAPGAPAPPVMRTPPRDPPAVVVQPAPQPPVVILR